VAGSCNEDQEAEFWRPSGNEQVNNKSQLAADCTGAIAKLKGTVYSPSDLEQTEIDMSDILLLYCMRRKKAYHRYYTTLLSPLLVTPAPTTRALASSCFYAICSEFIPLINLDTYRYNRAVQKINEWIRLLLSYHFPLLVLHLDRVFPGWEQAMQHKGTAEVLMTSSEEMESASLDAMERDLGLSEKPVSAESSAASGNEGSLVSSQPAKESRERHDTGEGCIPSPWLSGIFGDTLPPEQACAVLDWAVLNEDKYFGVYFTASLFGLYSTSLMTMNRTQIASWIAKVNAGISSEGSDWFTHIPLSCSPALNVTEDGEQAAVDWQVFVRGWLHATTALRHMTPSAFKEAIGNTELWASNLVEEEEAAGIAQVASEKRRGLDDSGSTDSKKAKMLKMKNVMGEKSRNVLKRISKKVDSVRKSSQGVEIDNLDKWEEEDEDGREGLLWPHANKKNFRCLWASAQEVIPSMCTTQRKSAAASASDGGESKSFAGHFCHGCEWTAGCSEHGVERKGGEGMCFPQLKDEQHNMLSSPMFFTVDIRSEWEMKLGKFPKAFNLDPQSLSDPDMISNYLSTLEPVSEIAHLCVMGVGEEYIQAKVAAAGSSHSSSSSSSQQHSSLDTPSSAFALLDEALAEYHASLMNVVVFFQKKGFRHVSILDGGFVAAVRHLLRDDCVSSLGSALVDVFPPALDRILGEGTCAKHLGIKKVSSSSSLSSSSPASASVFEEDSTAAAGSSLLGSSVNNAIANFSTSSVGTNLGSFVSNLTAQVSSSSTASSTASDEGGLREPPSAAGGAYAAASTAEVGRRLSVFGSSALTSLRKTVGVAAGAPAAAPSTSGGGGSCEESKSFTTQPPGIFVSQHIVSYIT
jgi:hypothetical protein